MAEESAEVSSFQRSNAVVVLGVDKENSGVVSIVILRET